MAHNPHDGRDYDAEQQPDPMPSIAGVEERDPEDVPLFDFPRGAGPGTYLHRVLELIDFRDGREQSGQRRDLSTLIAELGPSMGIAETKHHELLATELPKLLRTPLGTLAGDLCLAELAPEDRLDELGFDLPLSGGDRYKREFQVTPGKALLEIIASRREHLEAEAYDPVPATYLQTLRGLQYPPLCGFLNGYIDLIYRVRSSDKDAGRWFICDYKSNRLGPPWKAGVKSRSTWADYEQSSLEAAMAEHHYIVQYHLYLVALHRYLGQRLPDYDYDQHIGGAVYIFLRGLRGPDGPRGARVPGVFVDRPPRAVIEGLSELFARQGRPPAQPMGALL